MTGYLKPYLKDYLRTTQTGISFTDCGYCGRVHPITRRHCSRCKAPTAFLATNGECLTCREEATA